MRLSRAQDPILANRFLLEIDGIAEAGFSECTGLVIETEIEERREGGINGYIHRLPRGTKFTNVVLKRGMTNSALVWEWHQEIVAGFISMRNISVVLLSRAGDAVWRWDIERAFPIKWSGPDLKADGNGVAIEALEMVHHGFKLVQQGARV
jgi:phage tail-like protein